MDHQKWDILHRVIRRHDAMSMPVRKNIASIDQPAT
jgi:hypothetical protein